MELIIKILIIYRKEVRAHTANHLIGLLQEGDNINQMLHFRIKRNK